jgi:hypothetical protein
LPTAFLTNSSSSSGEAGSNPRFLADPLGTITLLSHRHFRERNRGAFSLLNEFFRDSQHFGVDVDRFPGDPPQRQSQLTAKGFDGFFFGLRHFMAS